MFTTNEHSREIYLRETLLLQIRDDILSQEIRRANNVQHFFMVVAKKCKLEAILCGVDRNRAGSCGPVKAVDGLAFHPSKIDRVVKRADYSVITVI